MFKESYSEADVIKILQKLKETINYEIDAAINSNYAAIDIRNAKGINIYEDTFCQHCYGKIYALGGIQDFINETIRQLTGVNDEEK